MHGQTNWSAPCSGSAYSETLFKLTTFCQLLTSWWCGIKKKRTLTGTAHSFALLPQSLGSVSLNTGFWTILIYADCLHVPVGLVQTCKEVQQPSEGLKAVCKQVMILGALYKRMRWDGVRGEGQKTSRNDTDTQHRKRIQSERMDF